MFARLLLLVAVANCSLLEGFSNRPVERRLGRILGRRKRIYFNQDRERVRVSRQDDSYGSPAAPAATSSSPSSCPASCTCSCPSTPSTSLLYTPSPSFQPTAPAPSSSYQVSYNEEQTNPPYQLASQGYQQQQQQQQQPSNSAVSNPMQETGTL